MAEPTIQLGGGNWAGKTDNLLGYYKEGERFYKQDFTFSRSTTGTYTDKDGYIQEMPYNLLEQSNTFDQWSDTTIVLTSGQSGYDGSNDAWLMAKNGSDSRIFMGVTTSDVTTTSIYAKANASDYLRLRIDTTNATTNTYFNLANGSVYSTNYSIDTNIESVGNGWYRCSVTPRDTATIVRLYPAEAGTTSATSGSIYIQNAQLVKGTSAKTYFPTTTRLNMPRVSYLNNSNGSLILEPQRSNLITYSSDFSEWAIDSKSSIISNSIISPDGTLNATKLIAGSTSGRQAIQINASATGNLVFSTYAKKGEYSVVQLTDAVDSSLYANFDLENGTLGSYNNCTPTIIDVENGWYRCVIVWSSASNINKVRTSIAETTTQGRLVSFSGNGTDGIYVWGAQLEQGSYPTSIINTIGSSVTRNADSCILTNVADRIGQTEGTMFIEFDTALGFTQQMNLINFNNSTQASVLISKRTDGKLNARVWANGSAPVSIISEATLGKTKAAFSYKSGDSVLCVNGVLFTNSVAFSFNGDLTELKFPSNEAYFNYGNKYSVSQAKLYNTRLSNSELQALTT